MRKNVGLSGNQIKMIAVLAMLIDHIGWTFIPFSSALGQVFHVVGRMTAPLMSFFIFEGFRHTENLKKYILRLLFFAVISQAPYALFCGNSWYELDFNVIFGLLTGLLCICTLEYVKDVYRKVLVVLFFLFISLFCDWSFFIPLWCLIFYVCGEDTRKRNTYFFITAFMYFGMTVFSFSEVGYVFFDCVKNSLYCFGVLLFVPVVYLYNGRRSRSDGKNIFMSRLFYVFYPAHMLALYMIKFLVR